MIVKATDQIKSVSADICIIGGGAAGITIAREFDGDKRKVVLLESGDVEANDRTQDLYQGTSKSIFTDSNWSKSYLTNSRLRFLGGSSNHWGGRCSPLDELDFEKRDWIPHSGWPLERSELHPFYLRAVKVLGVTPDIFTEKYPGRLEVPLGDGKVFQTKVFHDTSTVRFGRQFLEQLRNSKNIELFLNSNVVKILPNANRKKLDSVLVKNLFTKKTFRVKAKQFVLAAGSVENARILLLNKLGNDRDLVGRFFSSHIYTHPAGIELSKGGAAVQFYRKARVARADAGPIFGQYALTRFAQQKEKLPNLMFTYLYMSGQGPKLPGAIRKIISNRGDQSETVMLKIGLEQIPNPNSRVVLTKDRDELGQRRVFLNWNLQSLDHENIRRATSIFGKVLGEYHQGRSYQWSSDLSYYWSKMDKLGGHQMGTTRMGEDPTKGVVDRSCRVFGLKNLFVAGSSVFPTAGCANPTFSVVALALRLADHLKKIL